MPKPKATPAQVREVLIAAGCTKTDAKDEVHPNATKAARKYHRAYVAGRVPKPITQGYFGKIVAGTESITIARLREHAATLGLAPERIDQILPANDGN